MTGQVTVNGVTFNVALCLKMGKEAFITEVGAVHFRGMKAAERKKLLEKAWKLIEKSAS